MRLAEKWFLAGIMEKDYTELARLLGRYVEQLDRIKDADTLLMDEQLELFASPGPEDNAAKALEIYDKELARLLEKRQRQWQEKRPSWRDIVSSFRLMPLYSPYDVQKADRESDSANGIQSDWANVFEDFYLAFLKEARTIESRRVGGQRQIKATA